MFGKKNKSKPQPETQPGVKRTMQHVNDEYFRLAAELGELEFNYATIPARQEKVIARIKELQAEGESIQTEMQAEVAKAQAQAAAIKAAEAKAAATAPVKANDAQPA